MNALPSDFVTSLSNGMPCLVCGGNYRKSRIPALFECGSCGFISADLSIPEDELRVLYSKDYFHGHEYLDYVAEEESLRVNFQDRLRTLRPLVPNWFEADLFEVGCAYGFFLEEVKNEVRSASGIDISTDAVRYAVEQRAVNALHGDYLVLDLGRQVDVVTMWDTVEHLKRPDKFIAKAAKDLKPGGVLAVTTGDIGSMNARMRGRHWRLIHPPTHMHYFSVATLTKLLNRYGFDVIHVSHPGNSRRLSFIFHFIIAIKMKRPEIYDAIKFWVPNFSLVFNLFDIMYVIARKSRSAQDQ